MKTLNLVDRAVRGGWGMAAVPLTLALLLAAHPAHAQRMPQDSWYLAKEFRGDIEGGKFFNPSEAAIGPDSLLYVADRFNHQIQVFDLEGNFIRKWGAYGTKAGSFNEPTGIYVSTDGLVYVCDYNHRIQIFNNTGKLIRAIGEYGTGPGRLNQPHGIAVDSNGDIYVCEFGSSRVSVFKSDGNFVKTWGSFGSGNGEFQRPVGLCLTPDQKIAVLERDGSRVQVFDKSGAYIMKFGTSGSSAGQLSFPHGIDTDSSGNFYVGQNWSDRITVFSANGIYIRTFGSEGSGNGQFNDSFGLAISSNKIYVADYSNNRICVFTLNGAWIKNFGSPGKKEFSYISSLAKNPQNEYFIVDSNRPEIRKLNNKFEFLLRFGSDGAGNGQFRSPAGISISQDGRLYIADRNNHRIQIFDLNGNFIGKFGVQGTGNGQFQCPEGICVGSDGKVFVADTDNHRVQVFNKDGDFLFVYGKYGSFDGDFSYPRSIAISPRGEIAVSDWRTQFFTSSGEWVRKVNIGSPISFGSDGLIYSGSVSAYSETGEYLKNWWVGGTAAIETAEGNILVGSGSSVMIWNRTYRTVHREPSNLLPLPTILSQKRRPGTSLVDVDYTVKDADNATVQTAALAFKNGGNSLSDVIPITSFADGTGNKLGANIATGQTHRFTWDVARDWSTDFGEVQLEILAKDGRGLLNLDFIQIPATGNQTALKISRSPLTDNDFLSLWYWLIATGDSGIKLENGEVSIKDAPLSEVNGLTANYFSNPDFTGDTRQIRVDNAWASGYKWERNFGVPFDVSSIKWSGQFVPQKNGQYTFYIYAYAFDWNPFILHEARVWVGDQIQTLQRINEYQQAFVISCEQGQPVPIRIEYKLGQNSYYHGFWLSFAPPSESERGPISGDFKTLAPPPALASGTNTSASGRAYLFQRMGLREATAAEVTRAKEAGTPGVINQWDPKLRVGPDERPAKINAYGFDTGADGYWVVPVSGN